MLNISTLDYCESLIFINTWLLPAAYNIVQCRTVVCCSIHDKYRMHHGVGENHSTSQLANVGSRTEEEQAGQNEDLSGSNSSETVSRYVRVRVWVT
jgi:hypothetical protein